MAIDTKPNLKDGKFEQAQSDILHLSGGTHIYGQFLVQSGGTFSILSNAGVNKVMTSDSGGTGTWQIINTGTAWGSITGVLSGQTDLKNALNAKLNITTFSGFTGTTLPNNYYNKTQIDTFTGTTLPNNYYNKTQINAYTGKTYNLSSPAVCAVGGVIVGRVLTGKTAFELIEAILVPEICGTLTAPTTTISISPTTNLYEIGCSISTLNVTGAFDRGCINPQGCSTSDKRSGFPNCYVFTGCQIVGSYACTEPSVMKTVSTYVVCASQTWTVGTCYDCGVQPIGTKGTNFNSPLVAGCTTAASCAITGIYPYYYGKLTGNTRPTVTSALVVGGTKVLAISTGTLAINFSSASNEYTWLAMPCATASKTSWYVTALDNGSVATAPSDKYPDECKICVTSAQACWTDICYKVYMSGTVGAISATLCFS